jgi:hypothetical protein
MRPMFLLAALLPIAPAMAHDAPWYGYHHTHEPPAPTICRPAEIRLSSPDEAWYDLLVDGRRQASSRGFDGPKTLTLNSGRHHLRTQDFMGTTWSDHVLRLQCGETVVAEIRDDQGLFVLNRFGAQPRPEPRLRHRPRGRFAYGHYGFGRDWYWRPHEPARPAVCTLGELTLLPEGDDWYDVYLDGTKVVENRVFGEAKHFEGLLPGTHFVRVTSFMGDVIDERALTVDCGDQITATISEEHGVRVL